MIKYEDNFYLKYVKDIHHSDVIYMGVRRPQSEIDLVILIKVSDDKNHIKELTNVAKITPANKPIHLGYLTSGLISCLDAAVNHFSNINKAFEPKNQIKL